MHDLARFADLLARPDPRLDLATALIAAVREPSLDTDVLLARLDELADGIDADDAHGICAALFGVGGAGFRGNRANYYDPDNSLLDRVLDRRLGIPITLAVVGIEVARRRGVELMGVGMPGHFLLRARHAPDQFFDAFDGGRRLDADGCRAVFVRLHGGEQPFEPGFLDPVSPTVVVMRILNNLRGCYIRTGDRAGLVDTLRLQASLPGPTLAVRRQLADALAADGRFLDAADELDRISHDDPSNASELASTATRLRARMN